MLHMRPRSPSADPAPCWSPQPQGPSPAKRCRLHDPVAPDLESPAQLDELTSVVFLAAGCTMQLQLEDVDLLLEPDPTSVLQVSLPGHTFFLVPEGLQSSIHLGQPGRSPASPQGAALLDMPQDYQGSLSAFVSDIFGLKDAHDPDKDPESGLLASWMDASAGEAAELHLSFTSVYSPWPQDQVAEPWHSTRAERYSPRSIWHHDLLRPFPSSPLQPLPPSPPPSSQKQLPPYPPWAPCKEARKGLFVLLMNLAQIDALHVKDFPKLL